MLISELEYTIRGKKRPKGMQQCEVQCDKCKKTFKRRYDVLIKSRDTFNQQDLCRSCSVILTIEQGSRKTFSDYNKAQKGKTLEERLGEEKAKSLRQKRSKNIIGENNPNYKNKINGAKGLIQHNKQIKGKTLEEIYGIEKAKEIKQKISNGTSGKNNAMFGKPSPKRSGNGWSGYYKGHYFRSMLELHYLIYLMDNNIQFESSEIKKHAIKYKMNELERNYFPDYYLIDMNQYIELKPLNLINSYQNKLKFEAAKKQLGNNFVILTEKDIVKIDLQNLYNKYINKEIIFDKGYDQKFIEYYNRNRKE